MKMREYWENRYKEHGQWTVGPFNNPMLTQQQAAHFMSTMAELFESEGQRKHFKRCLDFGCGSGRFTKFLKDYADTYVGYDPITRAVELVDEDLVATEGVFYTSAFPDGEFDLLVAVTVFQHMPDEDLIEALSKLNIKGHVLLIEDNMAGEVASHVFVRSARFFIEKLGIKRGEVTILSSLSHYVIFGEVGG